MLNIYNILNNSDLVHEYLSEQAYLFKSYPRYSPEEKVTFELNALLVTLERLIEDFELVDEDKKLIYVMDSQEYRGYVDPEDRIKSYIFNVKAEALDKTKKSKRIEHKKYRYEVLFHLNTKLDVNLNSPIFHERHLAEVARYKMYLILSEFKNIDKILTEYPDLSQKKLTANELVEFVKSKGLINVFGELAKRIKKTKRYDDLIEKKKFNSVKNTDWVELLQLKEHPHIAEEIKQLDYDTDMYQFFIKPIKDNFEAAGNLKSFEVDYKVLAFVCSVNLLLKECKSEYRLAFLSSNKHLTVYTKYFFNYFEKRNQHIELLTFLEDILYVRYPTVLINTIKKEKNYWQGIKDDVNNKLIPVISSALNQLKYGRKVGDLKKQLDYISDEWEKLRKDFIVQEHLEDLEDLKNTLNNKSIQNIDFTEIHQSLFEEASKRIDKLVDHYLEANSDRFKKEFVGEIKQGEKLNKRDNRWFIRSEYERHTKFIFQYPKEIQEYISIENGKITKIPDFKELKSTNKNHYNYVCVLFSSILKDWNVVLPIAESLSSNEKDLNANLKEEIFLMLSIAMRYALCRDICAKGWKKVKLNSRLDDILDKSKKAINSNKNNLRIQLSLFSLKLESFVYRCHKSKDLSQKFDFCDNEDFNYLMDEFNHNNWISKQYFKNHIFSNHLYHMYYKVLLSFYIFIVYARLVDYHTSISTPKFNEEKKAHIILRLKELDETINSNKHHILSQLLISICEKKKRTNKDIAEWKEQLKKLDANSFIKRFILLPVLAQFESRNMGFAERAKFPEDV